MGVPSSQGHLCDCSVISHNHLDLTRSRFSISEVSSVTIFGQELQAPGFLRAWILAHLSVGGMGVLWEGLGRPREGPCLHASCLPAHTVAVTSLSPSPTPSLCPRGLVPPPPKPSTGIRPLHSYKEEEVSIFIPIVRKKRGPEKGLNAPGSGS